QLSRAAARAALDSHAPEEALRLVELALPIVAGAADRLALLCVRDEALEMLRRPAERLEGLAELNALTEAIGEPHLEFDVMLRRSAALRSANEDDRAAEIARKVTELAAARADRNDGPRAADRAGRDGGRLTAPPCHQALRGAWGSSRSDELDHRARLHQLGTRHPPARLGGPHRRDPQARHRDGLPHEGKR